MALPPLNSIELCAGVGMLGEGVHAALRFLGIEHRTVCYVEREAPAAAQLVALMEAGALDPAAVWSDLLTFDGAAWRGCVDLLIAGFPCQDLSIAGRRAGLDGKRSGLFFDILDIADACGATGLVLENVAGIATATASVVDEAEGDLEERAAARVLGELADRGWNAEWITLSASDVGAGHGRARWFCFAWRMADTARDERAGSGDGPTRWRRGVRQTGDTVGDTERSRWSSPGRGFEIYAGSQSEQGRSLVANAERMRRERRGGPGDLACTSGASEGDRGERQRDGDAADDCGAPMADTSQPRLPHAEQPEQPGQTESLRRGTVAELRGAPLFFAPGPADPRWQGILDNFPALAPALEPGVRVLADGLALVVDESRTHQLRQVGNGVVALCAAAAVVVLLRRAGFA